MNTREPSRIRECLRALFDAALAAADPARATAGHLPQPVAGRTVVVGAGKASAAMASAFEKAWSGPIDGIVVTRHGHAVPCRSRRLTRFPTRLGRKRRGASLTWLAGSARRISWCA